MSDELAPFFESRETRLTRLPESIRSRLQTAADAVPGQADFVDKQFVSLWLARRVGMPREEVLNNFDRISTSFFGPGVSPGGAYDAIAAGYKPAPAPDGGQDTPPAEKTPPGAQDGQEYATTEGLARVGGGFFGQIKDTVAQSARAVVGGFEGFGQQVPAGLYSQAAAVTGAPGMPNPMADTEYAQLWHQVAKIENPYQFTAVADEPNMQGQPGPEDQAVIDGARKRMGEIVRGMDAKYREDLKAWNDSNVGSVSQEYRRLADFWYKLSDGAMDRWNVTPEFRQSTIGQFMASAGSIPATAALAALGPGGWLGMEASFYGQVESERAQAEGAAYDPTKALPANLASAVPQMVLERALGVERLMNGVLADMPKMVGKVRFGDFARIMARQSLVAGVEEGVENPAQGIWNDYMASLTYDQKREILTGDGAKKRIVEGVSGLLLGGLFGGVITAAEVTDVNRRVSAGQEYLTTKDGQPYGAQDFNLLRSVNTDTEILAQASDPETGKLLLAGANGDKAAQAEYNKRTLDRLFVKTEGQEVGGMALGQVNNVPVVRLADGMILPLDMTVAEDRAFVDNLKKEVVRQQSLQDTVAFLQQRVEAGRTVEVSQQQKTLQDFINESKLNVDEAAARIGIAKDVNAVALPEGVKPEDVRVLGANVAEYQQGVYSDTSHIYAGGNSLTAVEEVAEGYIKKRLLVGDVGESAVQEWRSAYEAATGTKTTTEGKLSNVEWFSKRVVDYAVANRKAVGLPKSLDGFFRTLGEHLKTVFRLAQRLAKLKRDGKLDANFENHLKAALGQMSPEEASAATRAQAAEAAAVTQDVAPEGITDAAADAEALTQPVSVDELDAEQIDAVEHEADFPKITKEGDRWTVADADGAPLGEFATQEAALDRAVKSYEDRFRAEDRAAFEGVGVLDPSLSRLLTDIRQVGGLRAVSKEKTFKGELRALADGLPKHLQLRLFRKNGKDMDALREALNERGYNYEYITDMLTDIDSAIRLLADKNSRGFAVSFSLSGQGDLFGNDTPFNLAGEQGTDFAGNMDRQAELAAAREKQAKAQMDFLASKGITKKPVKPDTTFSLAPQTDTPEFKAWFGNSKVVDAQGKPLVVYHGTNQYDHPGGRLGDFTQFERDKSKIMGGKPRFDAVGSWFSDSPKSANAYGKTLYPVYLSIKNPLKLTFDQFLTMGQKGDPAWTSKNLAKKGEMPTYMPVGAWNPEGLRQEMKSRGYDGLVFSASEKIDGMAHEVFVALEPEQVKSATGNRGTFDASNPDITMAMTGIPQNATQALQAQALRLRAKKLAATGQLIAAIQAGQTIPKRVAAVRRTQQASLLARIAVPLSSRLEAISPGLKSKMRQFDFALGQVLMLDMDTVTPFLQGMEGMKDADAAVLDLALKNGDTASRDAILNAYGLQAAYGKVTAMLEATRQRAIAAGYEVGQIEDYFPRHVIDVDGLLTHYYGQPQAGHIEQALTDAAAKALAQGRVLTLDERIEVVNNTLRGFGPKDGKPSNVKARKTDVVDMNANAYYADSGHALITYIESMNAAIEKKRFFGKFAQNVAPAGPGLSSRINLDASIGGYVEALVATGEITRAQQREVSDLLEARFNSQASSEFIKTFKTLGYITTMGKVTSAITQIQDLAFSLYENGVFDTMVAAGRASVKKSKISRKDLGLEAIADEFKDPGKLGKLLNLTFKITGLHYIDMIGKEAISSAKFARMSREAASGKLSDRTRMILDRIFPKGTQAKVIADLAAGAKTEDTLFAVFNVLADYQPITASEYPEFYLRHPNGRVFYMLKSYTLKQIDAFRREGITLIVHGNAKQKAIGFRNLSHLAALLFLVGVPVDWIKDAIMGRDPQLPDIAVDNVFKLLGVSRWNLWQFRDHKDPVRAAMELVTPPAPFLSYPIADAFDAAKHISAGDDIKPGDFNAWRILPFIGDPIYWLLGGGRQKVEKRRLERERDLTSRIRKR